MVAAYKYKSLNEYLAEFTRPYCKSHSNSTAGRSGIHRTKAVVWMRARNWKQLDDSIPECGTPCGSSPVKSGNTGNPHATDSREEPEKGESFQHGTLRKHLMQAAAAAALLLTPLRARLRAADVARPRGECLTRTNLAENSHPIGCQPSRSLQRPVQPTYPIILRF